MQVRTNWFENFQTKIKFKKNMQAFWQWYQSDLTRQCSRLGEAYSVLGRAIVSTIDGCHNNQAGIQVNYCLTQCMATLPRTIPLQIRRNVSYMGFFLTSLLFMAAPVVNLPKSDTSILLCGLMEKAPGFVSLFQTLISRLHIVDLSICDLQSEDVNVAKLFRRIETGNSETEHTQFLLPRLQCTVLTKEHCRKCRGFDKFLLKLKSFMTQTSVSMGLRIKEVLPTLVS